MFVSEIVQTEWTRQILPFVCQRDSLPEWGYWSNWGDQGTGIYHNPILPADYSDLDCIRIGSDYYAISSTFQYSPGMVILRSKDLVNWKIAGHVVQDLTQISPELNWDKMNRYGRGIWAGAIRYHKKKFWVYFGTPDEGYFMSTAKKAEGPWGSLHKVLNEKGWNDCCPFWDDDGQGYLIGTAFNKGYQIHLWKMTPDGKELIRESDKIIYQSKGSEANKLYKFNGLYYHFFSEVQSHGRTVMMSRSKNIWGPYEGPKQLSYAQKNFNEPNQGGIIQTQQGAWYFLTHHGKGDWSGRVMSLLPVAWVDGWPIIGSPDSAKIGRMVWKDKMPVKTKRKSIIQTSDEFKNTKLSPQWEWNYQPRKSKWSLAERKGWLRLYAFRPLQADNLLKAGNTLTQRTLRTKMNEVTIKMDISKMTEGQHAGLSHFGSPHYASLGVVCDSHHKSLEWNVRGIFKIGPNITNDIIWLKTTWGLDGKSNFYYSIDGKAFIPFGETYQMMWGSYRGDRLAIYSYNNKEDSGWVDIDYLHYSYYK
ncbi:MAG: glycoside hydrolase 43 family protein [Niabella sp.]